MEHELTATGAVRSLGPIPADADGVVISPDGTSYAYATSDQLSNGTALNRIVVVRPGTAAAVVADRVSDPNHPTADAPPELGLLPHRLDCRRHCIRTRATGGCGCGSFDMQMQSADSGIINASTGVVTALTDDASCPLSTVGPGAETACFDTATSGATAGIRIASRGVVTHSYSLSGTSVAGRRGVRAERQRTGVHHHPAQPGHLRRHGDTDAPHPQSGDRQRGRSQRRRFRAPRSGDRTGSSTA